MFESQRLRFPPTLPSSINQQQASSNNKPPPASLIRPSSFQRLGTPTITLPTNSVSFPSSNNGLRLSKPSSSSVNPSPTNTISNVGSSLTSCSSAPGLLMNRPSRSLSKPNLVFPSSSFNTINNNTINTNELGFSSGNQMLMMPTNGNNLLDIPSTNNNNQIGSLSSSPQQSFGLSSSPTVNSMTFSVYSSPSTSCSPSSIITSSNNQGFPSLSVSPSNSFQSPIAINTHNNNNQSGIQDSTQQPTSTEERVIVDFEEFEAAKENIIPLKGGRKATDLRRIFGKQPLQEIKPLQPIMLPGSGSVSTSLQSPPTLCTSFNGSSSSTSFNPLMTASNNVNACSTPMSPTGMFSPTSCMNSSFNGFNTIVALSAPGEDDCAMTDASPIPQQGKPHFNFSNLTKSKVCFDNHNMKPKLSVERKQFEKRIASLSNHLDPITVWLEYVEWIEKSYPTLSKASQYVPTLQACTKFILSNQQLLERYRNDERYLGVWLKYADQCLDPIDVFTFLESKKICLNHSELYIRWATLLEDRKDLKAADAVLEQGINRGAQPAKSLQTFHTGVKARFMKSILNRTASSTSSTTMASSTIQTAPPMIGGHNPQSATDSNNQRLPFNSLAKKPTSIRPTTAIPSGPLRSGPPIPSMKPTKMKNSNASLSQKNSPINNFVIYDESNGSAEKIAHAATTRTLPFQIPKELTSMGPRFLTSEQEQEKENNEKPDKWTNYSLPQQNDDMMLGMLQPIGASISKPASHFSIFVDEEFK
ncbi:predicted protein [Naegleria gruberi]|uniref:Predicted protein n=1 Tax=Naegleria gruberi TaxID=5762 RepID=D2VDM5_NAEGR|nr:uncharacterized protein NAEGRDRAFT_66972 [Naegleria gruberi]EFC45027.1 predicted protein [Naegleria gruberi]|eukprot:XP_002677771.1 predicted protein [Naegleria gruberi strain NEG-M]